MRTNLKVLGVVLLTLGLYTWVANAIPQLESVVPEALTFSADVTEAEIVAAGEDLFTGAGACTTCHGLGTQAPNLLTDHEGQGTIGQRCGTRVEGQDCKAYIYESIRNPTAYVVDGFIPMVFESRFFSEAQVWALVAHLQSQGGEVTVTPEDIQAAQAADAEAPPPMGGPATASVDPLEIMRGNLCFGCHLLDGEGVTGVGPPLDGVGARISEDRIRRALLDPSAEAAEGYEQLLGSMPPNLPDMLTARQLEVLVDFLLQQR
jgi:mono/diheme cytochrome c family protein